MVNIHMLRLQYEILNTSLESLAAEHEIPLQLLQEEASNCNWRQIWPSTDIIGFDKLGLSTDYNSETEEGESIISAEAEKYVEEAKHRLKVYSLAKEILLASQYFEIEMLLIQKTKTLLEAEIKSPGDIKLLSAILKDLTSGSSLKSIASMTLGTNEDGLPTVILRDLSNK